MLRGASADVAMSQERDELILYLLALVVRTCIPLLSRVFFSSRLAFQTKTEVKSVSLPCSINIYANVS